MKFDKKTIITILASAAGVIVLGGIIGFVAHGRHEGRNFKNPRYGADFAQGKNQFAQGNPAQMMSGMENIIATKDYTAFQTLFSGSRILEQIDTPEKFATRIELQTTIKKMQELQTQLGSGNKEPFGPMMLDDKNIMFNDRQGGNEGRMGRKNILGRGGRGDCH